MDLCCEITIQGSKLRDDTEKQLFGEDGSPDRANHRGNIRKTVVERTKIWRTLIGRNCSSTCRPPQKNGGTNKLSKNVFCTQIYRILEKQKHMQGGTKEIDLALCVYTKQVLAYLTRIVCLQGSWKLEPVQGLSPRSCTAFVFVNTATPLKIDSEKASKCSPDALQSYRETIGAPMDLVEFNAGV